MHVAIKHPFPSKVGTVAFMSRPSLTIVTDKDKWINLERKRWSKYFKIPISAEAPPGFPVNTLPIQRVLASLSLSHPESLDSAIGLFYQNLWVHYAEPTKPENMLAIVSTIVGSEEEAKKVIERSTSKEVKDKVIANTDQAFKEGAFGLPWFVGKSRGFVIIPSFLLLIYLADNFILATNSKGQTESFWGIDHLGVLCDHLGLERPNERGWKAVL